MVTTRAQDTLYRVIQEAKDGKPEQKMGYRYLGNTGMRVSIFSYGNWLTTDQNTEET